MLRCLRGIVALAAILCAPLAAAAVDPVVAGALLRAESLVSGKEVLGDSAFLISQGARRRGRTLDVRLLSDLQASRGDNSDPAKKLLRDLQFAMWDLRNAPVPRLFYTVPKRGAQPLDKRQVGVMRDPARIEQRFKEQGNLVFQIMQRALTCEGRKKPVALVGNPDYEYVSTHQVLGLLLAIQRKCVSREETAASMGRYVARVRDEFELELGKPLTDLQIERGVALCLAGQCGLVPASFVRKVAEAQAAHGGWRLDDPLVTSGKVTLEHTTALAYCLLAFASTKP